MDSIIMGANWWVQGPNGSPVNCRKRLETAQLPNLTKARDTFVAGGGFFRMSMPQEIEELSSRFSLRGAHADIRGLFGHEPGDYTTFTYYERLRDIMRGKNIGRVVTIAGLVNGVEQPRVQGKRAELSNYEVGTIVLYKDVTDGAVVHLMDFENNKLIMNGVDYGAEHNRMIAA